jgi:hypothetical protein
MSFLVVNHVTYVCIYISIQRHLIKRIPSTYKAWAENCNSRDNGWGQHTDTNKTWLYLSLHDVVFLNNTVGNFFRCFIYNKPKRQIYAQL